jgi:hypothetical protein
MSRPLLLLVFVAVFLSGCSQVHSEAAAAQNTPIIFLGQWGVKGQMPGQLDTPVGLAVDSTLRVYIADRGTQLLQKFTLAGVPLLTFEDSAIAGASAVAVDAGGGIYVANLNAGDVHVYFPEGDALRLFHVKRQSRFEGPFVFSTDPGGAIYLPDPDGGGIQVLNSNGRLLRSWTVSGLPGVARARPIAAVAAPDGFLYVGDGPSGGILKYRFTGERIAAWPATAGAGALLGLAASQDHLYALRANSPRLTISNFDGKKELTDDLGGRLAASSGAEESDTHWLAVTPDDELLVMDAGASHVFRFQVRLGQHP